MQRQNFLKNILAASAAFTSRASMSFSAWNTATPRELRVIEVYKEGI